MLHPPVGFSRTFKTPVLVCLYVHFMEETLTKTHAPAMIPQVPGPLFFKRLFGRCDQLIGSRPCQIEMEFVNRPQNHVERKQHYTVFPFFRGPHDLCLSKGDIQRMHNLPSNLTNSETFQKSPCNRFKGDSLWYDVHSVFQSQ